MPTVAEIAAAALDGVASAIPDAVLAVELFENDKGAWDTITATHPVTEMTRGTCRAVLETTKPINDVFPDFIAGPSDKLFFLEGLSNVPKEGWILRISGQSDMKVKAAQDILLAGAIAYVVAA